MQESILRLKDGRDLGFRSFGDPAGRPVFFFHGTPGSRVMLPPEEAWLEHNKIRVVTADRPGFGLSAEVKNRRLLDWPDDVCELADHLGINRFAVIGFSGGGPYAAACAYRIPQRLTGVAMVCSLGPQPKSELWYVRWQMALVRFSPVLLRVCVWPLMLLLHRRFSILYGVGMGRLPECDREIGQRPEIRSLFRDSFRESFRQGSRAFARELALVSGPWGFQLQNVQVKIQFWHGRFDPFQDGAALAGMIPNCRTHFLEEGHLLLFRYWKEILNSVLKEDA